MLTKEQEKLLDDIHSKVIEYLHSTTIKANKTDSEIKSDMDISIGESSDFRQIKILVDKYLEHAVKTNSPRFYNQLFSGFSVTGYIAKARGKNHESCEWRTKSKIEISAIKNPNK